MAPFNRRIFLKNSAAGLLPVFIPFTTVLASGRHNRKSPAASTIIRLFGDGEIFASGDYLAELQHVHAVNPIIQDRYGIGGVVEALEKRFAEITGKEKAIYMPSGTMANEFALAVLSGEKTKIFVQDTSHVYRDEADAAHAVFGKRLMPLAKDHTYFTAAQLQSAIENLKNEEYIPGEPGAVSIENPNRRMNGTLVPLEEIKKISAYCRSRNLKLHLDGARIFMASAWTGISVKEYSSYFDTVYISLYKYLGASGGAVLCGPNEVIDKMPRLIKIHGGSMFGNWLNAAMALHRLNGFEARLQEAKKVSEVIFTALNKMPGIKVEAFSGGTNVYSLEMAKEINGTKLRERLDKEYNIRIASPDANNRVLIMVNETLLKQKPDYVINAFSKSI